MKSSWPTQITEKIWKNLQNWASNYIKLIKHLPDFKIFKQAGSHNQSDDARLIASQATTIGNPQPPSMSRESQMDPRAWWRRVGPAVDVLRVLHEDEGKGRHIATFRNHRRNHGETTQLFDPGSSDTKGHLSTWALDWRQTVSPDSKLVAMAAMAAMALSDPTGDSKPGEGVFPAVAGLRES